MIMSMAMKYAMQKRSKKMGAPCDEHGEMGCGMCHGGKMAEGGFVEDEEASGYQAMPEPDEDDDGDDDGSNGIVDRIMKRFAKGGAVANDTPPEADFEENDFDVLPEMEDTEADETGANSGDEMGDKQEDEDRHDIVGRIMKSRSKKDRMPRPA